MFGTNEISKPFRKDDGSLLINELFYTIQGEGPDAGRPAIFVRLAKCNLRCFFCDTEFEKGREFSLPMLLEAIAKERKAHPHCDLVVITGGEPLLQNIFPFVHEMNKQQMTCTIETAGTVWLAGLDILFKSERSRSTMGNAIICSPKTPKVDPRLARAAHCVKYIINHGEISDLDGLPIKSTQRAGEASIIARPKEFGILKPVYVQPMDVGDPAKNHRNLLLAATIAMEYGYRLSVQVHKIAQLP